MHVLLVHQKEGSIGVINMTLSVTVILCVSSLEPMNVCYNKETYTCTTTFQSHQNTKI